MTRALRRFFAAWDARNREFVRDRSAMAWNFLFPVLVVLGFAYAFNNDSQPLFKVGVVLPQGATLTELSVSHGFLGTPHVQWVSLQPDQQADALRQVARHGYDLLWSPSRYWSNPTSPRGQILEKLVVASDPSIHREEIQGEPIRYVDWLISGLLAMNMMFSALFGVGYTIVRYRKTGVLKRLRATPLSATEFLLAQVGSRMILMMAVSTLVYSGTHAIVHFRMQGSYLDLMVVLALGSFCLISLGLLVAARISSEEFAGGLLNLASWPMIFLSGVWFSLEGAHPWVRKIAQIFPLTHVIDAARAIMTEGATLLQVTPQLTILATLSVVFLGLGAWSFRWE